MSTDLSVTLLSPKELCYWMFGQLYKDRPEVKDWYINIRAIHNHQPTVDPDTGKLREKTTTLLNRNYPVLGFRDNFLVKGGIYDQLQSLNLDPARPCNIYFGVNPRTSKHGNSKKDIGGGIALYLDLDDNKSYTKEMRLAQLQFWIGCGLWPSFYVDSGRGYHPYWILDKVYPREETEPILKRIVAITGCKQGGNTWDITRVLRLPGFLNQKKWFQQESLQCLLAYPDLPWLSKKENKSSLMRRYTLKELESFPPSESADIQRYTEKAHALGGDPRETIYRLVEAAMKHRQSATIHEEAQDIIGEEGKQTVKLEKNINKELYEPKLTSIPPDVDDIPFPRGKKVWMRIYIKKGFNGLTPQDQDQIKKVTKEPELDASGLDYRIMYALIKIGYTQEAIRELWERPSLNLYRPDKEARSQRYWLLTFEHALDAVRNAIAQRVAPTEQVKRANVSQSILVHNNETFFSSGENVRHLLNGAIELKKVYIDKDATLEGDREYYATNVTTQSPTGNNGNKAYEIIFPRKAFTSPAEFRKKCQGNVILLTDKGADLAHLHKYLTYTYPNIEYEKFHSKVVYADDRFIFPKMTIYNDHHVTTNTFEMIPELHHKFPWHETFLTKVCKKERAQSIANEAWSKILRVHSPMLVSSVIGTIAAIATRAILEEKDICSNLHLPTINVRGSSSRGKSLTVGLLYKLCGMKDRSAIISLRSSAFSLTRVFELSNFLPVVVDEFKMSKETAKYVEQIRDIMRRSYTGETTLRGRADLGLIGFKIHGTMIVIGEAELERAGDVSEFSRTIPIDVGNWRIEDSIETYNFLESFPIEELGPHFYQYLLNQNHQKLFDRFQTFKNAVINRIKSNFGAERTRIAHNIAAVLWGASIYDDFIQSLIPGAERMLEFYGLEEQFCEYISENAFESGKSLVMHTEEGKREITARNELFEFLSTLCLMIQSKDRAIIDLNDRKVKFIHEAAPQLCLHFPICYAAYRSYCLRMDLDVHEKTKLLSIIRDAAALNEPWLLHKRKIIRVENMPTQFVVFHLQNLKRSGVWTLNSNENTQQEEDQADLLNDNEDLTHGDLF